MVLAEEIKVEQVELSILTKEFQDMLTYVNSAIAPFNVDDIYSYVHIHGDKSRLIITAGNSLLSKQIEIQSDGKNFVIPEGIDYLDVCVPAVSLLRLIKAVKTKKSKLIFEENQVLVKAGGVKARLPLLSGTDYPSIPFNGEGENLSVQGVDLNYLYSTTLPTAGDDLSRPTITGICHTFGEDEDNGELVCLSTNGLSASKSSIVCTNLDTGLLGEEYIIHKDTAREALRLIGNKDDSVINLRFSEEGIMYSFENKKIYSPFINGEYPRKINEVIEGVFARNAPTEFKITKKELLHAITLSELYNPSPVLRLVYSGEHSALRIQHFKDVRDKLSGGFKFDVIAEGRSEDLASIVFSGAQLKSAISAYEDADKICIQFDQPTQPISINLDWDKEVNGHFLLPIRTPDMTDPKLDDFSPEQPETEDTTEK